MDSSTFRRVKWRRLLLLVSILYVVAMAAYWIPKMPRVGAYREIARTDTLAHAAALLRMEDEVIVLSQSGVYRLHSDGRSLAQVSILRSEGAIPEGIPVYANSNVLIAARWHDRLENHAVFTVSSSDSSQRVQAQESVVPGPFVGWLAGPNGVASASRSDLEEVACLDRYGAARTAASMVQSDDDVLYLSSAGRYALVARHPGAGVTIVDTRATELPAEHPRFRLIHVEVSGSVFDVICVDDAGNAYWWSSRHRDTAPTASPYAGHHGLVVAGSASSRSAISVLTATYEISTLENGVWANPAYVKPLGGTMPDAGMPWQLLWMSSQRFFVLHEGAPGTSLVVSLCEVAPQGGR